MQAQPERTWWQRNLKWVIIGVVVAGVLFLASLVGLIVVVAMGAMRSSEVYATAVARAQNHPALIERLGAPIETGFFTSGSVSVENSSGEADLQIPLEGPLGEATLYVVATKRAGRWSYSTMQAQPATGEAIDLEDAGDEDFDK